MSLAFVSEKLKDDRGDRNSVGGKAIVAAEP